MGELLNSIEKLKMENLLNSIEKLKNSEIKDVIAARMKEFSEAGASSSNDIFKELCFCLLTANFSAEGGMKIQDALGEGFRTLDKNSLTKKLKDLGHRFPNARAKYIIEARQHKEALKKTFTSFSDDISLREWVVENVKGLGYKEGSHFLRNIGYNNLAIIDFHIIDLLVKHGLIERPKTLTKNKYLEVENLLREISSKTGLNLAELDLYLWYMETGKILK